MLRMIKGKKEIIVPNNTKANYERVGYVIKEDKEIETKVVEVEEVKDYTDKPIAKWTAAELKEFVVEHELDLKGATKTAEVREIVKAYLED